MEDNKKYIWLCTKKRFGRILRVWDGPFSNHEDVKKLMVEHEDRIGRSHVLSQLVFPMEEVSKPIEAYEPEHGENIFVCVKTKNNKTTWEQFYNTRAVKKYLSSFRVGKLKEVYILSQKDMLGKR